MKTQKILLLSIYISLLMINKAYSQSLIITQDSFEQFQATAEIVYFNGNFITMTNEEETV